MILSLIAACDMMGGIGKSGKLPWHFKEDLQHFKDTTKGHICIMGRRTYDEIASYASKRDLSTESVLPDRTCYVISSTEDNFPGATHINYLRQALDKHKDDHVFIIGGEKLFIQCLPTANHVYLTVINKTYECDRHFPIEHLTDFEIKDGKSVELENDIQLLMTRYDRK